MRIPRDNVALSIGLLACAALLTGCSGGDVSGTVAAMNDANVRRVANLYMAYQIRHDWRGPTDEAAFRSFIANEMSPDKLALMQVDPGNFDGLLVSERDGQPFRVKYGFRGAPMQVIAAVFEQSGRDGKRQVARTDGTVEEVDEARWKQLWDEKPAADASRPAPTAPPSGG